MLGAVQVRMITLRKVQSRDERKIQTPNHAQARSHPPPPGRNAAATVRPIVLREELCTAYVTGPLGSWVAVDSNVWGVRDVCFRGTQEGRLHDWHVHDPAS